MENLKENSIEQMIAELYMRVTDLERRITLAEEEVNKGGVYLDGVPDHLKEFIEKRNKAKGDKK